MKATLNIAFTKESLHGFESSCQAMIRGVQNGAKWAAEASSEEILADSNTMVPVDTATLLESGSAYVEKRTDVNGYKYDGVVEYGGRNNPVNPRTGKRASEYVVQVHEDITAPHINGQAKFLEQAVMNFADKNFSRTCVEKLNEGLEG